MSTTSGAPSSALSGPGGLAAQLATDVQAPITSATAQRPSACSAASDPRAFQTTSSGQGIATVPQPLGGDEGSLYAVGPATISSPGSEVRSATQAVGPLMKPL